MENNIIPYKTTLTEATELCWNIRQLADNPNNIELQGKVFQLTIEFLKYIDTKNKETLVTRKAPNVKAVATLLANICDGEMA